MKQYCRAFLNGGVVEHMMTSDSPIAEGVGVDGFTVKDFVIGSDDDGLAFESGRKVMEAVSLVNDEPIHKTRSNK